MTVTILAVAFLVIMLLVAAFGFKAIIKRGKPPGELHMERCSLCRQQFHKTQLVERQVGDYKLYFFCPSCITSLHNDLTGKN